MGAEARHVAFAVQAQSQRQRGKGQLAGMAHDVQLGHIGSVLQGQKKERCHTCVSRPSEAWARTAGAVFEHPRPGASPCPRS